MYIERQLEKKFIAVSEEYACVLLTGPRQVGKSTMLRHLMEGTARAEVSGRFGGAQTCQNRSCNVLEAAPCTGSHR